MDVLYWFSYENIVSNEKNVRAMICLHSKLSGELSRHNIADILLSNTHSRDPASHFYQFSTQRMLIVPFPEPSGIPRINPHYALRPTTMSILLLVAAGHGSLVRLPL